MELDKEITENCPFQKVSSDCLTIHHDPVGNHIIELREYYRKMEEKLEEGEIKEQKPLERGKRRKNQKPKKSPKSENQKSETAVPKFPKFPKHYPFSPLTKPLPENRKLRFMKYNGELPRLKETRNTFIENVLLINGYCFTRTRNEIVLVEYLSEILDDYLKKFVDRLLFNKTSEQSSSSGQDLNSLLYNKISQPSCVSGQNLWNALETTLRNFGIGGIGGLHAWYYEKMAKKHDIIHAACEEIYAKYKEASGTI